jgi:predicted AAA+ superfamily ATPase
MEYLFQLSNEKLARIQLDHVRNIINKIDWSQRMIGIKGARGVGKTTLLLQYLRKRYGIGEDGLYISADNLYFADNKLYDLASLFSKKGGKILLIDEIHRYPDWSIEIKNIYDDLPDLKVVFTGSSLLQMHKSKADLSRRAVFYDMPGLSFREFLEFELNVDFPLVTISDLLEKHVQISSEIISGFKPLQYFDNYLAYGYYPFYLEGMSVFEQKLMETVNTVLEIDIPQLMNMQVSHIHYLKRLLQIISVSAPFQPNLIFLSERSGISLNTLKAYMFYLHEAHQVNLLYKTAKGINSLNKPAKIFLNNTNLMSVLGSALTDQGSLRETFFFNQYSQVENIFYHSRADFIDESGRVFEVGGRYKNRKQIVSIDNSYLVKDQIEIGSGQTIPLWLFGFLY